MSSIEGVAAELRRSGAELVMALQSTKEIKQQAFERLDKASRELAEYCGDRSSCRGRSLMISTSLQKSLRTKPLTRKTPRLSVRWHVHFI